MSLSDLKNFYLKQEDEIKRDVRMEALQIESGGHYPTEIGELEIESLLTEVFTDYKLSSQIDIRIEYYPYRFHYWRKDRWAETDATRYLSLPFGRKTVTDKYVKKLPLGGHGPMIIRIYPYGFNDICVLHEAAHVLQLCKFQFPMMHDFRFRSLSLELYKKYIDF